MGRSRWIDGRRRRRQCLHDDDPDHQNGHPAAAKVRGTHCAEIGVESEPEKRKKKTRNSNLGTRPRPKKKCEKLASLRICRIVMYPFIVIVILLQSFFFIFSLRLFIQ